jgi:hypothetical protein
VYTIAELLAGQLLLNSDYHRTDIVNYKFSCISFEKLALTPRKQLKARAQCTPSAALPPHHTPQSYAWAHGAPSLLYKGSSIANSSQPIPQLLFPRHGVISSELKLLRNAQTV